MDAHHFVLTTPVLPWPADQGNKLFLLETARGLRALGDVTWVTRPLGDQREAIETLRAEGFELVLDESFVAQDPIARLRRRFGIDWRAWRNGQPREIEFVSTPTVRRLVAEEHRRDPRAIGVAIFWSAAPVLASAPSGRRVYIASDVEWEIEARGLALAGRSPSTRRVDRLREAERRAFSGADLALCLTEEDIVAACRLLDEPGSVQFGRCPVAVPVRAAPFDPPGVSPDLRILVYGHWSASFNRDGLDWFLGEVWPELRAHPSRPRLQIVGRGAPASVGDDRVESVGYVEDLDAELARCDVVAIPLRYAGGFRYRLLEAMAVGRPVLATSVAAVGCDAVPGQHFWRADTVDEWKAGLTELADPDRAARMRVDAHRWVGKNHDPAALAERLRAALGPVLAS